MFMVWKIDNQIYTEIDGNKYFPSVSDLYESIDNDFIIVSNKKMVSPMKELGLRFSRIGLSTDVEIECYQGKISIKMFANKGEHKIEVPIVNGLWSGYIVFERVLYYIDANYSEYNNFIAKQKLEIGDAVPYISYMNFTRSCDDLGLEYKENIKEQIENDLSDENELNSLNINATLFEYQKKGFNWMSYMVDNKCGCILADEMGLGKTLQIIALFAHALKKGNKHFLVVAPVSLLENWKREISKFCPAIKCLVHHGSYRTGSYKELQNFDVIITSYSNVQNDFSMFNMIKWDLVVLDEAQNIKNPYAKRTKIVKSLQKRIGIAVTGTPFENHMTDLWSIIDYIIPGYLGSVSQYESMFQDTEGAAKEIEKILSPIMIRRKVKDVAKDLPPRIDIPQPILMSEMEASYYESGRQEVINDLKQTQIDKIQKLRMFCTHPAVYDKSIEVADPTLISGKYSRMCEILEEICENDEKTIIFTSFNKMSEIMMEDLPKRFGCYVNCINGSTPTEERQKIVDEFTNINNCAILVLNPKAAGTGLNITAANHVIHYNLEWNPALEDQASARAYRRGQKKTVFIHRLFYVNTIDEVINERIQLKRDIFDIAVVGNKGEINDNEDLIKALKLSPIGGKNGN